MASGDLHWVPPPIDLSAPHPARMHNYWLGGGHNFAVDRDMAEKVMQIFPGIEDVARINQAFLRRTVLFMVESGIRQFLDIGSGLPNVGMVHELVGQRSGCSVVYVDADSVAVAYSQLLLDEVEWAAVLQADLRDIDGVLRSEPVSRLLDLDRPIGLIAPMLHFLPDRWKPGAIIGGYEERLTSGSYLALAHVTGDSGSPAIAEAADAYRCTRYPVFPRTHEEIAGFCAGFDLVEPGLVHLPRWRPEGPGDASSHQDVNTLLYGAVGRKP
jgi:S-adenosyl methyltransferase